MVGRSQTRIYGAALAPDRQTTDVDLDAIRRVIAAVILFAALSPILCLPESENSDAAVHAALASEAQQRGDLNTAIREYIILSHLLPGTAEIENNLGIAYYQNRQPELALRALEKAHALKPDLYSPLLFSGLALYQLGRYREATRDLIDSCRRNPGDLLARHWLAYSLIAQSEYDVALKQLESALRLEPGNSDLLYLLYRVNVELGRRETKELVEKVPDSGRVWQLAADQWVMAGNQERAKALYQQAVSRLPDLSAHRPTLDDALYWSAETHEAAAKHAAEKLARIDPDGARTHQITAETLQAQLRFHEAIAEYKTALQLNSDLSSAHLALGDLLLRTGNAQEAIGEYNAELNLSPSESGVHFHRGLAFMALGDEDRALEAFMTARRDGCNIPELHEQLGKLFLRRHDHPQAIFELAKYVTQQPTDPQGHYLLMMAYRATNNAAAVADQEKLFETYSRDRKKRNLAQQELGQSTTSESAPVPESLDEAPK